MPNVAAENPRVERWVKMVDDADAIMAKADSEKRAMTVEETAQVDELLASSERDRESVKRRAKIASLKEEADKPVGAIWSGAGNEKRIFANAKSPMKLKAFSGANAEEDAHAFGMWLRGAFLKDDKARQWCAEQGLGFRADMGETNNTLGGVLVPPEFSATIIRLVETYGVYRQNSMVEPMARDTKVIPRRTGGLTAYAVPEGNAGASTGAITASDITWDSVQLVAKKFACLGRISAELNDDAVTSLGDRFAEEAAFAFALKEDQCGFIGDGTSTYHGIMGLTTKINDGTHAASLATATGITTFPTLTLPNFEAVAAILPQYAVMRNNAKWYISRAGFYNSMQRLMDAAGGNTNQTLQGGPGLQFLGYEVVITQVLPATATTGAIVAFLGDLRLASSFGDRQQISLAMSDQRYFEYDEVAIKATERIDISNHDLGDASTAGPIVALKMG